MLRQFLKDIAPPAAVQRMRGGPRYSSWQDAKAASSSYADEELNRFRVARAAHYLPDGSFLRKNVLGLIAIGAPKRNLVITDFGGATGELALDFLAEFPLAEFAVVENATLVRLLANHDRVRFTTEIPPTCDVFFSSGALQFTDDPAGILEAGFAAARHAVVLARNSFSETEIFRVHRSRLFDNGGGLVPAGFNNRIVSYPHRTIDERVVHAVADRHRFRCVASLPEPNDDVLPYRGLVYGRQIAFLKR